MFLSFIFAFTFTLSSDTQTQTDTQKNVVFAVALASKDNTKSSERLLTNFLFNQMQQGDVLAVTDGTTQEAIATITLTKKPHSLPAIARKKMIAHLYARDLAHIKAAIKKRDQKSDSPNLLRYLDALTLKRSQYPNHTIKAVFLGSPIVNDPNPLFTMADSRYPNDAHFGSHESIYQTHGKSLQGVELHIIHSPTLAEFSPHSKDLHKEKIKRFWALYLQRTGGNLASFAPNTAHLTNFREANFQPIRYELDTTHEKIDSIKLQTPQEIQQEEARKASLFMPLERNPTPPQHGQIKPLEIGIRWDASVDLDLYTKVRGDDKELFYRQRSSRHFKGRHHKDITSRPRQNGFETVTYVKPVSINQVQSIYVNHYGGYTSRPINTEIRIRHGNAVYFKKFQITSESGDRGKGNRNSIRWVKIDPLRVVGLR